MSWLSSSVAASTSPEAVTCTCVPSADHHRVAAAGPTPATATAARAPRNSRTGRKVVVSSRRSATPEAASTSPPMSSVPVGDEDVVAVLTGVLLGQAEAAEGVGGAADRALDAYVVGF